MPTHPPATRPAMQCRGTTVRTDPLVVLGRLVQRGIEPDVLYSPAGFGDVGRHSILAWDELERTCFTRNTPGDPFEALRSMLAHPSVTPPAEMPPELPFCGGWIGHLSYDLLHHLEEVPTTAVVEDGFPLIDMSLHRNVLVHDRATDRWTALSTELEHLDDMLKLVVPSQGDDERTLPAPPVVDHPRSNFTREAYLGAVTRALDYIAAGDIYEVCLSQRFSLQCGAASRDLARRLLALSAGPFSAWLPGSDRSIVSISPERFLRCDGRHVETRPIKGTRPRGQTPAEDHRLRDELLASEKDAAELVMITDLLRNDLGRVCRYGSVRVPGARELASYRNVHHTYSLIEGTLRDDTDVVDLLRATFPGGSITGAPKVRAMEIIDELEPTARGPYCGSIGYLSLDGRVDLSIAIRTLLQEGTTLSFQVGGAVVADSAPAAEYDETLAKARGILHGLGLDERSTCDG